MARKSPSNPPTDAAPQGSQAELDQPGLREQRARTAAEQNPRRAKAEQPAAAAPPATAAYPDTVRDADLTFDLLAAADQLGPRLAPRPLLKPTPEAPPLPPVTEIRRFNTSRLLPAKYSESVLTRIAENDEDLQLIFALENATNERLLAEQNFRLGITARELVFAVPHYRIVNAAFTHPHPQGGRFSMPYRGAWYAGFELATAKAEVLFHRALQFAEIRWTEIEELDYDQYLADFCGSFHDLRPQAFEKTGSSALPQMDFAVPSASGGSPGEVVEIAIQAAAARTSAADFSPCLDPRSYVASQQLTLQLMEAGSLGVLYPSARRATGECIACFRPSVVSNVRKRDLYRLTWYPDRAATFLRVPRGIRTGAPAPV